MEEKEKKKTRTGYLLDLDKFMENLNAKQPKGIYIRQRHAAEMLDMDEQRLTYHKKKPLPKIISLLKEMSELSGCTIDELIKPLKL